MSNFKCQKDYWKLEIGNSERGQSLIEILIAIGLASILFPAILTGLVTSREGKAQQLQRVEALPLLKEAQEATRSVREKDWNTFAVNGTFHPVVSSGTWTLQSGNETINGFARQVDISDVYRDTQGSVVSSGGTLDPSTKKVVSTVSWGTPFPSSVTSTLYLTRFSSTSFTHTTVADFTPGTQTGTTITNNSGGEVTLGAGGQGNWCSPNLSISSLDLPGQGITTAISAIQGHAYTTSGFNSSGNSMDSVNITDPAYPSPPVATIGSSYNNYKTYGVFATPGYVYLSSDHPGLTVDIVQVTNTPFLQVGTYNAPGIGKSVYVSGNIGYVLVGSKLYTFDLSSKTGARPTLGSVNLAGVGTRVVVIDSYAYVSEGGSTSELQIIQVSPDGKTLTVVGQADVNGQAGIDVFVNSSGTRAYVVTNISFTENEFYIVDTSTKTGNRPVLGSYNTNGMSPWQVVTVPGNKAIIVGIFGEQYQVVDISNEAHPVRCGGISNPNGAISVNAVSSVTEDDGDVYSYILTTNSSKEFQIIEGGSAGSYSSSGTFESSTFDAGKDVAFNSFTATVASPSATIIKFQFAGAHQNQATGNCTGVTFNYAGPDGTSNSYYSTSSASLALSADASGYENPARCFRYKTFLSTTDRSQSPILYDMTINYSQ